MDENAFKDKAHPPTAADVTSTLGSRDAWLRDLRSSGSRPLREEWKYYGQKIGWTLKLFEGSRNLCFVTIGRKRFWVGFVFGDRAVEAIEASQLPAAIIRGIVQARRYAEGRGIRLEITSRRVLAQATTLLGIKRASIAPSSAKSR